MWGIIPAIPDFRTRGISSASQDQSNRHREAPSQEGCLLLFKPSLFSSRSVDLSFPGCWFFNTSINMGNLHHASQAIFLPVIMTQEKLRGVCFCTTICCLS